MTHVVTDNCIKCKYTACVEVCPVDCFHEGPNFLAIDPDTCIDCTLCIAECPAGAIYWDGAVPADQAHFLEINAELASQWPVRDEPIEPAADADAWNGVINKLEYLDWSRPVESSPGRRGIMDWLGRLGGSDRDRAA